MRLASPLRYPGGKWRLTPFFKRLLLRNDIAGCDYVEPYAGGASLALSLLFSGMVNEIHLNDLDPAIYSFWWSILHDSAKFLKLLRERPLTLAEWRRQRGIYQAGETGDRLSLGFATFYLNRTNHSGIMNGGVIGGTAQQGEWRIDCRFNKLDLERRIRRIIDMRDQIKLSNLDALQFLGKKSFDAKALIYLDPPYFTHGSSLYLNSYSYGDHKQVATAVRRLKNPWVVSYDDVRDIRDLYRSWRSRRLSLLHTARATRLGREIMFFSDTLSIPRSRLPRDTKEAVAIPQLRHG
jgi:DNA adenine methylase